MQRCAENCSMLHAPLSSKDSLQRPGCFICTKFINSSRKLNTTESSSRPKLRLSRVERGVTVSTQKRQLPWVEKRWAKGGWGVEVFIAFVCLRMKNIQKYCRNILECHFPFSFVWFCLLAAVQCRFCRLRRLQTAQSANWGRAESAGWAPGGYCIGIRNNITFQFVWPQVAILHSDFHLLPVLLSSIPAPLSSSFSPLSTLTILPLWVEETH